MKYFGRSVIESYIKKKTIKMNNLKQYLDEFYWYDETNESLVTRIPSPELDPEYLSTFQTFFGLIPSTYLRIRDKVLPHPKLKKLDKFLISKGFDVLERGFESFKYVHFERKIIITGDAWVDKRKDISIDDDDDDYPTPSSSSDEAMHISMLPTISNKIFITALIKKINTFLIDVSNQIDKFYLIAENQKGLFTQKTKFKSIPIKDGRYDIFYGENFPHDKMKRFIEEETENLMLLHGDPGTGKSNYIKHIITNCKKKVIYIPPSMLSVISSPGFVTFMMENKDTILLIEDAEEVLSIDRNSATNNLLGLTDGFLKDALNLKIIATFNCNIGKIDPALLRKGRMFLEYKFDSLTIEECKKLSDFTGFEREVEKSMTLAEFFNVEDNHVENSFEERKIGFV